MTLILPPLCFFILILSRIRVRSQANSHLLMPPICVTFPIIKVALHFLYFLSDFRHYLIMMVTLDGIKCGFYVT